ncbi:hypothetical protein Gotur_034499 [Gossypium turneri]
MPRRRLRDLSIVQNTPNSEETNSEKKTAMDLRIGRRRTLLKDLYELNPVERVKVSRNNLGQPIGSEAQLLVGDLGIIARNANMLPLNYESWHQMPDSNKNEALDNIKRSRIIMSRRHWEKHEETKIGTSSRQKQKFTHTAGSKSFACVAEAELDAFSFLILHRKKDEFPMTSEAVEIMEKLKDKKAEYEVVASSDSSVNVDDIDNRIITEVLGLERYGRMQASTIEQIAQLKAEAAVREAEQSRKYDKLQLQL